MKWYNVFWWIAFLFFWYRLIYDGIFDMLPFIVFNVIGIGSIADSLFNKKNSEVSKSINYGHNNFGHGFSMGGILFLMIVMFGIMIYIYSWLVDIVEWATWDLLIYVILVAVIIAVCIIVGMFVHDKIEEKKNLQIKGGMKNSP